MASFHQIQQLQQLQQLKQLQQHVLSSHSHPSQPTLMRPPAPPVVPVNVNTITPSISTFPSVSSSSHHSLPLPYPHPNSFQYQHHNQSQQPLHNNNNRNFHPQHFQIQSMNTELPSIHHETTFNNNNINTVLNTKNNTYSSTSSLPFHATSTVDPVMTKTMNNMLNMTNSAGSTVVTASPQSSSSSQFHINSNERLSNSYHHQNVQTQHHDAMFHMSHRHEHEEEMEDEDDVDDEDDEDEIEKHEVEEVLSRCHEKLPAISNTITENHHHNQTYNQYGNMNINNNTQNHIPKINTIPHPEQNHNQQHQMSGQEDSENSEEEETPDPDLINSVTKILQATCLANNRTLQVGTFASTNGYRSSTFPDGSSSLFFSLRRPTIALRPYISRLVRYVRASRAAFVVALMYLDRVHGADSVLALTDLNVHRLVTTALMLAVKFVEDEPLRNSTLARIGGVPTIKEMNLLEVQMLRRLGWNCSVDLKTFDIYERCVIGGLEQNSGGGGVQRRTWNGIDDGDVNTKQNIDIDMKFHTMERNEISVPSTTVGVSTVEMKGSNVHGLVGEQRVDATCNNIDGDITVRRPRVAAMRMGERPIQMDVDYGTGPASEINIERSRIVVEENANGRILEGHEQGPRRDVGVIGVRGVGKIRMEMSGGVMRDMQFDVGMGV